MTTQSIIVYRNPLEQAMWEGLMTSVNVIPVLVGIVAFFTLVVFTDTYIVKRYFKWRSSYASNVCLAISAVIAIVITNQMWIS
jgi:hypothetical protein